MKKEAAIIIATHKNYIFPNDDGYMPIHVGRSLSSDPLPFIGDDTGDNISGLNKSFCELTGLYWLWKNQKSDFYGLVHYRRYFKLNASSIPLNGKKIASSFGLLHILDDFNIILSKPRNYVIETVRSHYNNAHHSNDLDIMEQTIKNLHPTYHNAFLKVMNRRTLSLYNMFMMGSDLFNNYCEWLFSILLEMKNHLTSQEYGPYQRRVFGFLGERLLNIWVEHNIPPDKIKYLKVVNLEGENLCKKAIGVIERKFTNSKPV